jgi:hypothetical protein
MNVKQLREYLADFPESADVEVVVGSYVKEYSMAWGEADGGTKATAHNIAFMVSSTNEREG